MIAWSKKAGSRYGFRIVEQKCAPPRVCTADESCVEMRVTMARREFSMDLSEGEAHDLIEGLGKMLAYHREYKAAAARRSHG